VTASCVQAVGLLSRQTVHWQRKRVCCLYHSCIWYSLCSVGLAQPWAPSLPYGHACQLWFFTCALDKRAGLSCGTVTECSEFTVAMLVL
jgi:hypothetical protein